MSETMNDFEKGVMLGLLIGEGSFYVTHAKTRLIPGIAVKMHVRHEGMLRWLHGHVDGSEFHGPYEWNRRHWYTVMIRGKALARFTTLLDSLPWQALDPHSFGRYTKMLALTTPGRDKSGINEQLTFELS